MRDVTRIEVEELEQMIDGANLKNVLDAIAQIARLKANHIREAWYDEGLAKTWIKDAKAIEKITSKIYN